ncbi:MAG: DUF1304 domain-containing protein [Bacteroidota bacterium]
MALLPKLLISIVALEHLYILYIEMFAWTTKGRKTFKRFPPDLFEPTKQLAGNQGLYNGFLSAGLIWSLLISDVTWSTHIACFFLACVITAGIYGAITVQKTIFYVQAMPAILALLALLFLH